MGEIHWILWLIGKFACSALLKRTQLMQTAGFCRLCCVSRRNVGRPEPSLCMNEQNGLDVGKTGTLQGFELHKHRRFGS